MKQENIRKLYRASKRRRTWTITIALLIFAGYLFFFTSNLTIPQQISQATEIGKESYYAAQRSVTVYDVTYDKQAQLLEVVLALKNETYDNVNDYYFFPQVSGRRKYGILTVNPVIQDTLITVLRIEHLKPFDEVKIVFAPKLSENLDEIPNSVVGSLVFNRTNLKYEEIQTNRTRSDYLRYRFEAGLKTAQEALAAAKEEKQRILANVDAIEKESEQLTADMKYFTDDEKKQAKAKINAKKAEKAELLISAEKAQQEIELQEKKYKEAYDMLDKNFEEEE